MKKNLSLFILIIVIIIAVAIFLSKNTPGKEAQEVGGKKLQVNASFYPLYFFASQIGGDRAAVYNITPAGAEPHDYDPSTQDIARIENGDMLILNGGVEAWGDKIKYNLKDTKVKIIVAGLGFLNQQVTEEGKTQTDPHIWLNPQLAKKEVKSILKGYIETDPQNKEYYYSNTNALIGKLDQLDNKYNQGLMSCQQKDIVTSHAAFGYLAARYRLNQVSITGLSPDAEPSSQQLTEIVRFAKEQNVKYIFFESLVSPKLSETIASEIGAKTLVLDPIEGLSDDDISTGKNYFTVMEDNLHALQIALGCEPK